MTKRIIAIGKRLQPDRVLSVQESEPIRVETVKGIRTALRRVYGDKKRSAAK